MKHAYAAMQPFPCCDQSVRQVTDTIGLSKLASCTKRIFKAAPEQLEAQEEQLEEQEEQLEAQEEQRENAAESQAQNSPQTKADKRWIAKSAYILLVSLQVYDDAGGPCDDAVTLLRSEKIRTWTKYSRALRSRVASVDVDTSKKGIVGGLSYRHIFIIPDICHHIRTYESMNNHIKDQFDLVTRNDPLQKQVTQSNSDPFSRLGTGGIL